MLTRPHPVQHKRRRWFNWPHPERRWWRVRLGYGSNVTIGIVAKSAGHECIVSVSDRQISWDDEIPSIDNAILKDWVVSPHWGAVFAANDACFARPILRRTSELLASSVAHS